MRFNHAPTEGYETDVGSRTSIRIVNSQVSRILLNSIEIPFRPRIIVQFKYSDRKLVKQINYYKHLITIN